MHIKAVSVDAHTPLLGRASGGICSASTPSLLPTRGARLLTDTSRMQTAGWGRSSPKAHPHADLGTCQFSRKPNPPGAAGWNARPFPTEAVRSCGNCSDGQGLFTGCKSPWRYPYRQAPGADMHWSSPPSPERATKPPQNQDSGPPNLYDVKCGAPSLCLAASESSRVTRTKRFPALLWNKQTDPSLGVKHAHAITRLQELEHLVKQRASGRSSWDPWQ